MKKIAKKNVSNKVNSDNPIVLAPKIDKLTGVVNMKDKALCGMAYHGMIDWLKTYELGVVKVPVAGKYQLAVKIHFPDKEGLIHSNGPSLLLQLTHPNSAKLQVRFEYNPAHINEAAEDHLDVMLMELMGLTFYEFLYHARFTRVDFCRDILLRNINDYLIQSKYSKMSQCFFNAAGKLETITLGKTGNNQITAYDKSKEMYGTGAEHSVIRIEARCRINLNIMGLAKFENPFSNLCVYSMLCKKPPFGTGHWRALQDSCRLRGVGNAIKNQPVEYRSKLKKVLSQQPVKWWDIADEDWSWLLSDALDNAGLTNIPDAAPPLSFIYHTVQAA